MNTLPIPLMIILGLVAVIVGPWVAIKLIGLIGFGATHIFRFVGGMVSDAARIVGSLVTILVYVPLVLLNVLIGRWSASAHFGKAISSEISAIVACVYRITIGHPARLLGLGGAVEGLEQRVPRVMAAAPTKDTPSRRAGAFDGYTIIGSLAGGGSGGKLYVAEPTEEKYAAFERAGHTDVDQVVIKTFSLDDGSSLPQIVRENRALSAAKNMGLVLEHDLSPTRFHYVMRYVPGKPLGQVAHELHARAGAAGLSQQDLHAIVGYLSDLTRSLDLYHRGGLWHKDVKPDNIIVDADSAHLVDFGLITPLRSAMTLTTHGTEYFRDPEMVRMALRGAKVHEVDGAKFDIYAAGAVLYSMIENSFPAHGALSQFSKPCPDSLRWIIRRSMADYGKRYTSAGEMLADLEFVFNAENINALRPAELPSVRSGGDSPVPAHSVPMVDPRDLVDEAVVDPSFASPPQSPPPPAAGSPRHPRYTPAQDQQGRSRPRISVVNWWTGEWKTENTDSASGPVRVAKAASPRVPSPQAAAYAAPFATTARSPFNKRMAAREQVRAARRRAANTRKNAAKRLDSRRKANRYNNNLNWGTFLALLVALGFAGGIVLAVSQNSSPVVNVSDDSPSGEYFAQAESPKNTGPAAIVTIPEKLANVQSRAHADGSVHEALLSTDPNADETQAAEELIDSLSDKNREVLSGSVVVFLSDLLPPLEADVLKDLGLAHVQLTRMGVRTISSMSESEDGLDDAELSALAEISRARGQSPLKATTTSKALSSWLDDHDDIGAITWLGADSKLYVFTRHSRSIGPLSEAPGMITDALLRETADEPCD